MGLVQAIFVRLPIFLNQLALRILFVGPSPNFTCYTVIRLTLNLGVIQYARGIMTSLPANQLYLPQPIFRP